MPLFHHVWVFAIHCSRLNKTSLEHVQVVQDAAVRLLDKVSSSLPLESTLRF